MLEDEPLQVLCITIIYGHGATFEYLEHGGGWGIVYMFSN